MNLRDAEVMARSLMDEHGLTDWRLVFDRAVKRFGVCRYDARAIGLSKALTERNTVEVVRNTVLHEIAHALVGGGHGHDAVWRRTAQRIGCTGERCYQSSEVEAAPSPYALVCPSCRREIPRHRVATGAYKCRTCRVSLELRDNATGQIVETPRSGWAATCHGCGRVFRRARRPKAGLCCGTCRPCRPLVPLVWKREGVPAHA